MLDLEFLDWDEQSNYSTIENAHLSIDTRCCRGFIDQHKEPWGCCAIKGHKGDHYWVQLVVNMADYGDRIRHGKSLDSL